MIKSLYYLPHETFDEVKVVNSGGSSNFCRNHLEGEEVYAFWTKSHYFEFIAYLRTFTKIRLWAGIVCHALLLPLRPSLPCVRISMEVILCTVIQQS